MMDTNVIYCGDCLEVMKTFSDESIDLIYLDPPFFSQKNYENFWIKDKASKFSFSDKDWEKMKSKINPNILKEYEAIKERWKGGHKGIHVYLAYMRERLEHCWRILKKTGSIYLHCDWHASHYLKEIMDRIFGYDKFKREIIWSTEETSGFKSQAKNWIRAHDTILFYTKTDDYIFNKQFIPHKEEYIKRFKKVDDGRRYRDDRAGGRRQYLDETEGKVMGDVWNDVMSFQQASTSSEYLSYPTQKPEALLDRIIKTSSNEGNIVLDPFCGCGTAIVVANRLKRKWIGIDISRTACDIMRKRVGGKIRVIGGESEKELSKMEPHEFARIVIVERLGGTINPKKTGDMGIDGWVEFMTRPVQVKRWGNKVGRPEVDKFKSAIQRENKKKGMIVAFEFSKDCFEEAERIKHEDKIDIQLKSVREVFGLDYFKK